MGKKRFFSIRLQLIVALTVIFTLIFTGVYLWFIDFATQSAMARIEENLRATALAAADGIDGDQLSALYREAEPNTDGLTDDPRYWQQVDWLDTVHQIEPRAWPYTIVAGDSGQEIVFVADLWAKIDPEASVGFQEICTPEDCGDVSLELRTLTEDVITIEMTPYTDEWGTWVSAWAPVHDSAGQVVGAVGVDFDAAYVFETRQQILNGILIAFVLSYTVLIGVVVLISRTVTKPLEKLTATTDQIAEGRYDLDLSSVLERRLQYDEISLLAERFALMSDKVNQREQSLRREVAELKIEIDRGKADEQVREIVETEFFDDLKAKAAKLRSGNKSTE